MPLETLQTFFNPNIVAINCIETDTQAGIGMDEASAAMTSMMAATGENGTAIADMFTDTVSAMDNGIDTNALEALLKNRDVYEQMLADYQNGIGALSSAAIKSADTWGHLTPCLSSAVDFWALKTWVSITKTT